MCPLQRNLPPLEDETRDEQLHITVAGKPKIELSKSDNNKSFNMIFCTLFAVVIGY